MLCHYFADGPVNCSPLGLHIEVGRIAACSAIHHSFTILAKAHKLASRYSVPVLAPVTVQSRDLSIGRASGLSSSACKLAHSAGSTGELSRAVIAGRADTSTR